MLWRNRRRPKIRFVILPKASLKILRPASKEILGRGGIVRIEHGKVDVSMGAAYFPPASLAREDPHKFSETCKHIIRWMQIAQIGMPERCTPFWGVDLNAGLGGG